MPPTGEYRFKLPRPLPKDYDYTGDYKDFGVKCPQPTIVNENVHYEKGPSDENCTYLHIWVPASDKYKPEGGWPVLFYIHGGWLQNGEPNIDFLNTVEAFDDDEFTKKYILVSVGYRLNMFGFLSGKELLEEDPKESNMGFYDQRLAMEWVHENIQYFGGNPDKFTLSGLSAGSYSTFFQLCYELYHPEVKQIIKQLVFFSNIPYVQPKTIGESQAQFDEVIEKIGVPASASSAEKMKKLRSLDISYLEDLISTLKMHTFRSVTDEHFISSTIIDDLTSGKLAKMIEKKGLRLMLGEVDNEFIRYALLNTPQSIEELPVQVQNYYPKEVTDQLMKVYGADQIDPTDQQAITGIFGKMVGDGQVYASTRGFLNYLKKNDFPASNVFRYAISYRAKWLDEHVKPEYKVPHAVDFTVWFYNLRKGYTEQEREHLQKWLQPYVEFLNFEEGDDWDREDLAKYRYFKTDGTIEYIDDPYWDWGTKVADAVYECQK